MKFLFSCLEYFVGVTRCYAGDQKGKNGGIFRKRFGVAHAIEDEDNIIWKRRHQWRRRRFYLTRCVEWSVGKWALSLLARDSNGLVSVTRTTGKKDGGVNSPTDGNNFGRTGHGHMHFRHGFLWVCRRNFSTRSLMHSFSWFNMNKSVTMIHVCHDCVRVCK